MSDDEQEKTPRKVEKGIKDMKIENQDSASDEEASGTITVGGAELSAGRANSTGSPHRMALEAPPPSSKKSRSTSRSPTKIKGEHEEIVGGEITLKLEPGQPPKLSRSASQKVLARAPPMFDDYDDKTEEAIGVFQVITQCSYSPKSLGSTEHAMECDCAEEWDSTTKVNYACGDDSDCINRATKMECVGDCGCGADCQNQRFQRQQYANVSVIKTEKKGYGLRTDADLQPNDFIFEYIGEAINDAQFRRRMLQYDEEGIKHFYFMSLSKGEFVDATKKGNLGRFCNHSCNPNCYVDKWVVGDKLRMGIFAERKIKAGEELVFNYNVDRYGADPQPCYCGELNCTGFIGGKTQTERATKLSHATIEALGIDDGDGWDTAVAKKPRRKKAGEDDEEYVNNVQPRSLDEEGVTKVMATLMQCKDKWIAVKLLGRIQSCNDEKVINRVVKMHGYQILSSTLAIWKEDFNVVIQVLDILNHFPRLTKNKISDSKIEATVASLEGCGDERVESQAASLLNVWSTLETAYRIPRMKRDPNNIVERQNHFERRESAREKTRSRSNSKTRSRSRSLDAPKGPAAPTGPRNSIAQRNTAFFGARPPFRPPRPFNNLPTGWFTATSNGSTYYYSANGQTTWSRPTLPAAQPPPPPKPTSANKALDDIINQITSAKANTPDKVSASATPKASNDEPRKTKKEGKEKWRTYSEEKQKKLYENTLFPHIKYVVDKYRKKLPKEELKKFAKEISKKLVNSDFKNHRVEDPTHISSRQEKQVKKYVQEFFEKAVAKKKEHDKKKAEKKSKAVTTIESPDHTKIDTEEKNDRESDVEDVMEMSDDEDTKQDTKSLTPITPLDCITNGDGLKRKRESDELSTGITQEENESTPSKRPRSITPPTPAPPPPPPPADGMPQSSSHMYDSGDCGHDTFHNSPPLTYVNGPNREEGITAGESMVYSHHSPSRLSAANLTTADVPRNGMLISGGYLPSKAFGSLMTPHTPNDDVADEKNQRLGNMIPERSRYLEAQESR